jgi:Flp pilus assembly protein TadB
MIPELRNMADIALARRCKALASRREQAERPGWPAVCFSLIVIVISVVYLARFYIAGVMPGGLILPVLLAFFLVLRLYRRTRVRYHLREVLRETACCVHCGCSLNDVIEPVCPKCGAARAQEKPPGNNIHHATSGSEI